MGIYRRRDSPFWWMQLEGSGKKLSTGVLVDARTAEERKEQRASADAIYRARMTDQARKLNGLPQLRPVTQTVTTFAGWFKVHVIPKHRGAARELEILDRLLPFFGALDLTEVLPGTVDEYATMRMAQPATRRKKPDPQAPKVRPGTVNREIAVLKSLLVAAVSAGHLTESPLAGLPNLRTAKRQKRTITPEEETRLLAVLAPADRALYVVAVDTLARLSNVLNLTRGEDRGTYLALTDSKTGSYEVPLSSRARAALDSLPNKGPYFFPHRRSAETERDRRAVIRRMLQRGCAKCDPPIPYGRAASGVTWHTATRATGATRMLRAGVDQKTVQAIGHWASFHQMGEYFEAEGMAGRREAVNLIAPITPQERPSTKRATHGQTRRKTREAKA